MKLSDCLLSAAILLMSAGIALIIVWPRPVKVIKEPPQIIRVEVPVPAPATPPAVKPPTPAIVPMPEPRPQHRFFPHRRIVRRPHHQHRFHRRPIHMAQPAPAPGCFFIFCGDQNT